MGLWACAIFRELRPPAPRRPHASAAHGRTPSTATPWPPCWNRPPRTYARAAAGAAEVPPPRGPVRGGPPDTGAVKDRVRTWYLALPQEVRTSWPDRQIVTHRAHQRELESLTPCAPSTSPRCAENSAKGPSVGVLTGDNCEGNPPRPRPDVVRPDESGSCPYQPAPVVRPPGLRRASAPAAEQPPPPAWPAAGRGSWSGRRRS